MNILRGKLQIKLMKNPCFIYLRSQTDKKHKKDIMQIIFIILLEM